MKRRLELPEGKRFAFTVFDDTDGATVANVRPVYDLLADLGFRTTKSVWVYPPRGRFSGQCLLDAEYREFVLALKGQGFELALHNVGDGAFSRAEILEGLKLFKSITGAGPNIHVNHAGNPDNIYWLHDRFEMPLAAIYRVAQMLRGRADGAGHDPASPHFWGDACKGEIQYIRNFTFNDINTLNSDPLMPYEVARKRAYSNLWFSSSDGHTIAEMNALIAPGNCDRLEDEGGACIVYTHFASGFVNDGRVDPEFTRRLKYLASKQGWFVPVSVLLDHLLEQGHGGEDPGYAYRLGRSIRWALDRWRKRAHYGH